MIRTYFSEKDIHQIITREVNPRDSTFTDRDFKRGIPYTTLHRPCTVDDGITVLQQSAIEALETFMFRLSLLAE